eukprot:CAMPEP_0170620148 /NCGR_PEP_ID=MMETSP0224-20130122/27902_1 /TAXON_ID=285029 /ORGANISM="Togula jolla, Strain CCCM 725" /LENGTH=276 /DNA_ID=CAMNT_0010946299 /DNA_START=58 /DNA_END=888 /DNA_ORIENTATION=+
MELLRAVLALVLASLGSALLQGRREKQNAATAQELALKQEQEDRLFASSTWHKLNDELHQLEAFAAAPAAGLLQLDATPEDHAAQKAAAAKRQDVMAATKNLAGKAMLEPALGMLRGLYEDQKSRIGDINAREQKSKDRFAEQEKTHEAKVAHLKELLDNKKISTEFYNNSTKEEERIFSYWRRCRERSHKQFHTQLKITHGLMEKEKGMMKAYDKAIADKAPSAEGAKEFAKARQQVAPEIVLLQQAVESFCHRSLAEVQEGLQRISEPLSLVGQ